MNETRFLAKLRRFLRSFTLYQKIYLAAVVLLTVGFTVFLPGEMLDDTSNPLVIVCSVIAVLANPLCSLLISKQSKWNFAVDLVFIELTEMVLYFSLGWYTSALVTVLFWVPIDIWSFCRWHKHLDREDEDVTVVKRLTPLQDVLAITAILAFSGLLGFLMNLIPGSSDSYLESLCSAFGMADGILLLLRYHEQWYAWFCALILYAVLYILSGSYIMLITVAAMMVNTIYGFVKWLIYTRSHRNVV